MKGVEDMASFIKDKRKLIKQLVSYGAVGIISSGLDFAVFHLLTLLTPLGSFAANFISVNAGIACSFLLNSSITFRITDDKLRRAAKFFAVGYSGLVLSMIIMYVGTKALDINESLVKLGSIAAVALFQFSLNKLVTFRERK